MKKDLLAYKIIAAFLIITVSFLYVNQVKADILGLLILLAPLIIIDYYTCVINVLWGGCDEGGGSSAPGGARMELSVKVNGSEGPIPIIISDVTVGSITKNSAIIAWNTYRVANSYAVYSTNLNNLKNNSSVSETGSADLVTRHRVNLSGLNPKTTYYYYVKSTDSDGNTATDINAGNYYSFQTTTSSFPTNILPIPSNTNTPSSIINSSFNLAKPNISTTIRGPIILQAPADFILTWSATHTADCVSTWMKDFTGNELTPPQGEMQYSDVSAKRIYFTLTCKNTFWGENTKVRTLIVDIIGPEINLFGPTEVLIPDPLYINWTTNNVSSCSATSTPNVWNSSKPLNGPEIIYSETNVNNRGAYNFTLACFDDSGNSASDNHITKVIQVPRCNFTADPTSIILPQASTLSWSCSYADTCLIDQGVGPVNNTSDSEEVRPSETTTYTLTCDGLDETREWQSTVNVGFTPKLKEVAP